MYTKTKYYPVSCWLPTQVDGGLINLVNVTYRKDYTISIIRYRFYYPILAK